MNQQDYLSYLLRLWSVRVDGETVWRASLESAIAGQRMGFPSLDELYGYLRQQTESPSEHRPPARVQPGYGT